MHRRDVRAHAQHEPEDEQPSRDTLEPSATALDSKRRVRGLALRFGHVEECRPQPPSPLWTPAGWNDGEPFPTHRGAQVRPHERRS